ncbi:MAG: hypothetical protein OJF60_001988 [Burkholderiaceae bacterium]|nr:MAG: hypothetical protein OJF60_001988 [Burkholderiaceae bacterium]
MTEPGTPREGLFASLRRLLATTLELVQVRIDLLLAEAEREKLRVFDGLLWAGVGLMLLGVGVILLCGLIVALLWQYHRLAVLAVLTLLLLIAGAVLIHLARRRLRNPAGVLQASVDELRRDLAALKRQDAGD